MCLSQKQQLDADGNAEPTEYEVSDVSAARKTGGLTQFRIHWAGGVEMWGKDATSWEPLDRKIVLAAWEKHSERWHVDTPKKIHGEPVQKVF